MNLINRPYVELKKEELILIDATIELFDKIETIAHNEDSIFDGIEFEADKIVKYLSDFIDFYVKEI